MVTVIRGVEKAEIIDATPTPKGTFLALIRAGYTLPDAVAEYVDNSIEQAINNRIDNSGSSRVEVKSITEGAEGIIEIIDNCGGCPRRDAVRFIRPGESGVDPEEGNISRFGIGGKAAGLAVSSSVEILSRALSEKGWKIVLNRNTMLNKNDWKFEISDLSSNENIIEGSTQIRLHVTDFSDFQKFPIRGKEKLEERYGIKDLLNKISISFNGVKLSAADPEIELLNNIEAPERCIPLEANENIRVPTKENNISKTREISVKVKLGLMTEGSRINKFGMNIYCNGRLLVKDNKIGIYEQSFGDEKVGHAGIELIWIRGIVYLSGPAEAMPWNSRKNDLDTTSPTYRKLEEILKETVRKFLERMGEAKTDLKDRTGDKKIPGIRDVIVDHYYRELVINSNYEIKVRQNVRNSRPFVEAKKNFNSSNTGNGKGKRSDIPSPPVTKETVYLAAYVETKMLEEVREKIRKYYGKPNVTNADVVRIIIEHYKNCNKI
jgi:hypothetical protein